MGAGQVLALVLLLGTVTVIQTCKNTQNTSEMKPLHGADYIENEHIFDQFPESVGQANIDLPDMLILPVELHLAPSWRNKFGELEGRHISMEILEIVQQMFLHFSLRIKFFLKYDESSIKLSDKEVDLTSLGLKALGDYVSEPDKRAAIVYLKVTEGSLLGIANQAFICDSHKKKARSIVRWRDSPQETALVVAHEIRHILGIYHDFDKYVHTDRKPKVIISRRTHSCGPGEYNGGPNNNIMNYGTPISSSWSECNNQDFIAFYKLVTVNVGSFCLEESGTVLTKHSLDAMFRTLDNTNREDYMCHPWTEEELKSRDSGSMSRREICQINGPDFVFTENWDRGTQRGCGDCACCKLKQEYACHTWTAYEWSIIWGWFEDGTHALRKEKGLCEEIRYGNVFSHGNYSLAPGCGGCWCCELAKK